MRKFKPSIFLVFEFCEHDLAGLLKNQEVKFTSAEKKRIAHQLFNGLHYIHKNKVCNDWACQQYTMYNVYNDVFGVSYC